MVAVAGLLGAGALFPAASLANSYTYTVPQQTSLSFGDLKVHGYTMSGFVTDGTGGKPDDLYVSFRRDGKWPSTSQSHSYDFTTTAVVFKPKADLSSATLSANLGSFGRVNMSFKKPGALKATSPPKGCKQIPKTLKNGSRAGTLSGSAGSFKLVADKTYFKTVTASKFSATLSRSGGQTCTGTSNDGTSSSGPVVLDGDGGNYPTNYQALSLSAPSKGPVDASYQINQNSGGAQIGHYLDVTAPRTSFTASKDGSRASVGGLGGPFSGTASYKASDYFSGGSQGMLSGNLAARFDSIGVQHAFAAGSLDAILYIPGFKPPNKPPNKPPTASFGESAGPNANEIVFSDLSSDEDGSIKSRSWSFGDGQSSTEASPTHKYGKAGTYTVKLTVTDDRGGTASTTQTVTVNPNQPPTALFNSGAAPGSNDVGFYDVSYDPDGWIKSWSWSFGDGTSSAERSPKHTYAGPGPYIVKLTVTDNLGATNTAIATLSDTSGYSSEYCGPEDVGGWC